MELYFVKHSNFTLPWGLSCPKNINSRWNGLQCQRPKGVTTEMLCLLNLDFQHILTERVKTFELFSEGHWVKTRCRPSFLFNDVFQLHRSYNEG